MYQEYWNLQRSPFRNDCDPHFFFGSRTHRAALRKLQYVVQERLGAALLVGGMGYGKTFLVELLRLEMEQSGRTVIPVRYPRMTAVELLSYIAAGLGADASEIGRGRDDLDRTIRQIEIRLSQCGREGRPPVLVLDDAHLIEDSRVFLALQMLLNFQPRSETSFSLLLLGEPALLAKVGHTGRLGELIGATALLQPLTQQETAAYIARRLEAAGRSEPVFDESALAAVFELSGGVPRRINRLCDLALLVGHADRLQRITAEEVEAVADELTLDLAA